MNEDAQCPRCVSGDTELLADSPVPGTWTVTICRRCQYSWRSTEPLTNRSASCYPMKFRFTEADINSAQDVPPVPDRITRT
jgi:hypothetical protein